MKPYTSITQIPRSLWDRAAAGLPPFLHYEFFLALEESQSIGAASGWLPLYFLDETSGTIFYSFAKGHSYGEYIFDWQWARAYQQYGLEYYPKLTSMIPITPVTTPHFITPKFEEKTASALLKHYHDFYQAHHFSSAHFLFLTPQEIPFFESQGYLIRESLQYHFFNEGYKHFDDYLTGMKSRKAKQIRKERQFSGVKIEKITGSNLTTSHADEMYQFYLSTIENKNAIDYLKKDFFRLVFESMPEHVLYIRASKNDQLLAGSLFFYDSHKLYGRYWGSLESLENLHFELCYYQGIDFCIQKGLQVFEAGAQGEHKISRGFRPVKTYSAHRLKEAAFHQAIANFIKEEKVELNFLMDSLAQQLPFR